MMSQILNEVTDKVINLGFSKNQDDGKKQESRGTLLNTERLEIPWPNAMLKSWLYPGIYIKKNKQEIAIKDVFEIIENMWIQTAY